MPVTSESAPNKRTVLFRRILSSIILVSAVLGILLAPNRSISDPMVGILSVTLVGLGLREFFKLLESKQFPSFYFFGIGAGCLTTLMEFLQSAGYLDFGRIRGMPVELLAVSFVLILLIVGVCAHRDIKLVVHALSSTLFGVVYVSILFNFLIRVFYHPDANGPVLVIYAIAVTKCGDAGAYFVGNLIGKNALIPTLSPGKTWEGALGGIITSVGISVLIFYFVQDIFGELSIIWAILLGLLLGVGGIAGDLVESLFKRQSGLKDSGGIFPGIGGVLDLLDSLLFNAPILYFVVEIFLVKGANG